MSKTVMFIHGAWLTPASFDLLRARYETQGYTVVAPPWPPEPPILIGHSFGGLFVQVLLDRGLGAAGVAIDPAPPRGVLPGLTALRASLPVFLAWNGWNRTLTMTLQSFAWGFAQLLPPPEQRAA